MAARSVSGQRGSAWRWPTWMWTSALISHLRSSRSFSRETDAGRRSCLNLHLLIWSLNTGDAIKILFLPSVRPKNDTCEATGTLQLLAIVWRDFVGPNLPSNRCFVRPQFFALKSAPAWLSWFYQRIAVTLKFCWLIPDPKISKRRRGRIGDKTGDRWNWNLNWKTLTFATRQHATDAPIQIYQKSKLAKMIKELLIGYSFLSVQTTNFWGRFRIWRRVAIQKFQNWLENFS